MLAPADEFTTKNKLMIHTTKGLLGIINNTPITITSNAVIKWNLEDALIIQTINYTFKESLADYDVKGKDDLNKPYKYYHKL